MKTNILHGVLIASIALLLSACGDKPASTPSGKAADATPSKPVTAAPAKGAGGQKLALKANGKDLGMEVKSGVLRVSAQEASKPEYNHAIYIFTLTNFEMTSGADLSKTLSNPADLRVSLKLLGPAGSGRDTPLAPGTYSTEGKWPKFDNTGYSIHTVVDGKQVIAMSQDFPQVATKGELKITAVDGDTVKGEMDITTADKLAMKGPFTAKIKPITY